MSVYNKDHTINDRFIIKFIGAFDIPSDYGSKSDPYVKAYISEHVVHFDQENRKFFKLQRISNVVQTPKRLDCTSVIWNCYRDLKINPPIDSTLIIEIYNATSDVSEDKLLGKVDIPVKVFVDEAPKIFNFVSTKSSSKQKNPNFSITLSRAFIVDPPPLQKTFFVIRHGESKWNEAQSKLNVTGMLDRDHALTEEGIKQAAELNARWRGEQEEPKQRPSVVSPKGKDSKQDAVISFLEPEEQKNFATADLLGDFDNWDFNNTTGAVSALTLDQNTHADTVSATDATSAPKRLNLDEWDPFEADSSTLLDTTERTPAKVAFSGVTDQVCEQEEEDVLGEEPGRESFAAWEGEESADPLRSTSAIIDDFHRTNLDLSAPPRNYSLRLHSGENQAAAHVAPDYDEFFEQRREEYINLFRHADRVYSSPLTRAIETAYVSMEGHPALAKDGLTLYSIIREVKRIGGLDTVGIECGEGIKKRARSELKAVLGKERTDQLMSAASAFNVNDADQPWWTAMSSYETDAQQQDRVREFISFVRHCDAKLPIFVGHSLFFKAFYSKRISTLLLNNRPQISENLKKFRLSNASLLAVTVSFVEMDGCNEAIITDADLIFGGGFHGVSSHIVDEDEEDSNNGHGSGGVESSTSPQQFFSIAENIRDKMKNTLPHDLKSGKDALRKGVQMLSSKLNDFFEK